MSSENRPGELQVRPGKADPISDLAGRTALVTGGGQGIGAAIVARLADRGAQVLLFDRDHAAAEEVVESCAASGGQVLACAGDVSDRRAVRSAVELCVTRFGRLDMLAAVAGTAVGGSILDIDDASWRRVLAVNLDGVLHAIQEASRAMAGGGSIVTVASTNAFWVESEMAAYNASKGGVVALSKSAAIDLAGLGIRVNVVAPGVVRTRLARFLTDDPAQAAEYLKGVPLGRFATVDDVAGAALFLLSEEASYITGHTLVVDGGATVGVRISAPDAPFPGFQAS